MRAEQPRASEGELRAARLRKPTSAPRLPASRVPSTIEDAKYDDRSSYQSRVSSSSASACGRRTRRGVTLLGEASDAPRPRGWLKPGRRCAQRGAIEFSALLGREIELVGVTKEVMAPLDPGDIEAGPSQGSAYLSPGNAREASHATVIF